jgi:hypothetical protein
MHRRVWALIVLVCSHTVLCQTGTKTPPISAKQPNVSEAVKKEREFDPFVPRQVAETRPTITRHCFPRRCGLGVAKG